MFPSGGAWHTIGEGEWRAVARQLLAQGYAAVSGDGFGTVVLSPTSAEVLGGRTRVLMRRAPVKASRVSRSRRQQVTDMPQEALGLFEALRVLRRTIAEGGAYVNNIKVTDVDAVLSAEDVLQGRFVVLRKGKRNIGGLVLNG